MTIRKVIAALLVLGHSSIASSSFALDVEQKSNTSRPQLVHQKAPAKPLDLYKKDYMKSSYHDLKIDIIGPIKFSLGDDYVQHRFTNLDSQRSQKVRNPFESNNYAASTYYRSTVAKTGFKFKF